jgi:hypothetical protein
MLSDLLEFAAEMFGEFRELIAVGASKLWESVRTSPEGAKCESGTQVPQRHNTNSPEGRNSLTQA